MDHVTVVIFLALAVLGLDQISAFPVNTQGLRWPLLQDHLPASAMQEPTPILRFPHVESATRLA